MTSSERCPKSDHVSGGKSEVASPNVDINQSIYLCDVKEREVEKEKEVDSTVYEYDEVLDRMQEAKERQREVKEEEAKERNVCFSTNT